jgi:hypothetical protein
LSDHFDSARFAQGCWLFQFRATFIDSNGVTRANKKRRTPVNPRVRFIIVTSLKTSLKTKEIHLNGANVIFPS